MPVTKRGIYHNLKESKYTISNHEVVFFFSSKVYRDKFLKEYQENREKRKYKMIEEESCFNLELLADVRLYMVIEKRGFRVKVKNVEMNWKEFNQYMVRKMMDEMKTEWYLCDVPKVGMLNG